MNPKPTSRLALVALVCLGLLTIAPAVAQEEGWIVPDDYVPPDDLPVSPPPPLALQGPIRFDEAEFPIGTDMSNFATPTVGGAPLPGTLSFTSASGDISIGIGPGVIARVAAPLVRSRDLGIPLEIDFGVDVSRVSFGFAINCGALDTAQVNVQAFASGGGFIGQTTVPGADLGNFWLERAVDFSPGAGFRSVMLTFGGSAGCDRFAFDNLSYDDAVPPAPAMPAQWLFALALLLLGLGAWFAHRRTA